jgi:hypothetical protein
MSEHKCLYCRTVRHAATIEHFIPERLGWGHLFTLPVGAVCDRCQNWASQDVDPAIWTGDIVLRQWLWWFQVPGKRGRLGRISGDPGDEFDPKTMSATMPPDTRTDNDKRRHELFFSRAVHKMALGALAWNSTLDHALDPIFDPIALTMRAGAFLPYGRAIGRWVDEGVGIAIRVCPGDSIVAVQLYAVTYWACLQREGGAQRLADVLANVPGGHVFEEPEKKAGVGMETRLHHGFSSDGESLAVMRNKVDSDGWIEPDSFFKPAPPIQIIRHNTPPWRNR